MKTRLSKNQILVERAGVAIGQRKQVVRVDPFVDAISLEELLAIETGHELETDEEREERERVSELVHDAIGQLKEDEQAIIRLYYFQSRELTYIARETGLTVPKVVAVRTRAIRELRTLLGGRMPKLATCILCDMSKKYRTLNTQIRTFFERNEGNAFGIAAEMKRSMGINVTAKIYVDHARDHLHITDIKVPRIGPVKREDSETFDRLAMKLPPEMAEEIRLLAKQYGVNLQVIGIRAITLGLPILKSMAVASESIQKTMLEHLTSMHKVGRIEDVR